jgi:aryl-alcohol dehydrogenase-like predicted oxidoreductase
MPDPDAKASGTFDLADLRVHRMGFGAMRVTGPSVWGPPKDRAAAIRVVRRVVELGVDFIDTADSYGPHVSEEILAEALHPYPTGVIIATKGGLVRPSAPRWDTDARPERLRAACEGSLKRLRVDRIDVYQLHAPDPRVRFEDSVGELAKLRAEGKIRHVGLSNVDIGELERARAIVPIVSVQNRYNLHDRSSEDVLQHCEEHGIGFIPWYPLDAGALSRARSLQTIAQRHGGTPMQIALAWLLAHSPVMLPIPGTASVAHLEENVAASSIQLTPDDLRALDAEG